MSSAASPVSSAGNVPSQEDRERYEALHYKYEQAGVSYGAKRDKLRDERKDLQKEQRRLESQAAARESKLYKSLERKTAIKPEKYGERFSEMQEYISEAESRLPKVHEKLTKVESELAETEAKRAELFNISRAYEAAMKGLGPAPSETDLPAATFYGGGIRPGVGMPADSVVASAPKEIKAEAKPKSAIELYQEMNEINPALVGATFVTPAGSEIKVKSTTEKAAKKPASSMYDVSVSEGGSKVTFAPKGSTRAADPLGALTGPQTEEGLKKGAAAVEKIKDDLAMTPEKKQEKMMQQAQQKVMSEAFQEAGKEAQKQALQTGKPVTLTSQMITEKAVELVSPGGKYEAGVPVTDQKAEAEYLNQVQNLMKEGYAPSVTGGKLQFTKTVDATKGAADYPILTPLKGGTQYEGYTETQSVKLAAVPVLKPAEQVQLTPQQQREADFLARIPERSDPLTDIYKGFEGPFLNLAEVAKTAGYTFYRLPVALAGGKGSQQGWYDIQYEQTRMQERLKGDIEGDLISLGITAAMQQAQTGKTDVQAQEAVRMVQLAYKKNPVYLAGNIAASASMWLGPLAASKAAKGAGAVTNVSKVESDLLKAAEQAAAKTGATKPTSVQAVKLTEEGAIPLSSSFFGYVEKPGALKLAKPDAFIIRADVEEIGIIGARSGKAEITLSADIKEAAALTGQELIEKQLIRSEDPIQKLFTSEPVQAKGLAESAGIFDVGKKGDLFAETITEVGRKIPTAEKVGEVLKYDPNIEYVPTYYQRSTGITKGVEGGKIAEYSLSDLKKAAQTAEKARLSKIAKDADSVKSAMKARSFESVPKAPDIFDTSRALQTVTKERDPVLKAAIETVKEAEKAAAKVGSIAALGLGGAADIFRASGSLGLGGATGAEKAAAKGVSVFEETQYLAYPPESISNIEKPDASPRSVNDYTKVQIDRLNEGTQNIFKDMTNMGAGLKQDAAMKQSTSQITKTEVAESYEQALKQIGAQLTRTMESQLTRQVERMTGDYDLIRIPKKVKIPFPFPDLLTSGKGKKKGGMSDLDLFPGLKIWGLEKLENIGALKYKAETEFY